MSDVPGIGRAVRGGRQAFFEHADSDRLLAMLMSLASEHWVLRERVHLLERLLTDKGVLTADELDALQPDAEMDQALDAESFAFIQSIVASAQNIEG